ncbi:MAG: peptidase M28, partial [Candidatus Aminicenantes bacterium]|nr:peptidase M28 [Candidatus Aminicenantes bacterium]
MTSQAAAEDASAPQNKSIRKADMKADMLFFTSDSLNGRKNGTRDTDVAAEFIKARLDRMGLKGA